MDERRRWVTLVDDAAQVRWPGTCRTSEVTPTTVVDVRRLSVGHSRAMYRVDTDGGRFVVRVEQGGVFGTSSRRGVRRSCAASPPPGTLSRRGRWYEPTGTVLGQPFFVMDFVEGAELADERAMDEATAAEFVRLLAALHAARLGGRRARARTIVPPAPAEATHLQVERWAAIYRVGRGRRRSRCSRRRRPGCTATPRRWTGSPSCTATPVRATSSRRRPGRRRDRLGVRPPRRSGRGLVVLPGDAGCRTMPRETWLALFASVAGVPHGRETAGRYWEAFNLFKGACANRTCLACSSGASTGRRTWRSSAPCSTAPSSAASSRWCTHDDRSGADRRPRPLLLRRGGAPGPRPVGVLLGRGLAVGPRSGPRHRRAGRHRRPLAGVDGPDRVRRADGVERHGDDERGHRRRALVPHRAPAPPQRRARDAAGLLRRHLRAPRRAAGCSPAAGCGPSTTGPRTSRPPSCPRRPPTEPPGGQPAVDRWSTPPKRSCPTNRALGGRQTRT